MLGGLSVHTYLIMRAGLCVQRQLHTRPFSSDIRSLMPLASCNVYQQSVHKLTW